jgi:CheY-like chemotaxis protein
MRTPESIYVFIVDDDKLFQHALEHHLRDKIKLPVCFLRFSTGEECLANLWVRPDLIILDYRLDTLNKTAMTGIEVLEKIRKITPAIPILMISGQAALEIKVMSLERGAVDFIEKNNQAFERIDQRLQDTVKRVLFFGLPSGLHFLTKNNYFPLSGPSCPPYIRSRTFFSPIDLPENPPLHLMWRKKKKRSRHLRLLTASENTLK